MLNVALQGKAYPEISIVIEPERVDAFARAVAHRAGGVPPTFVTVPEIAAGLARAVADPELGLELLAVLHGEQEYEWHRALRLGETVTARSTIESIRGRGGRWFLVLRTVLVDGAGEEVVVARSTLIVREEG
jgi:hypothetical protein